MTTQQQHNIADILCSRPWFDDDSQTWNIEHLWIDGQEYTVSDSDGNHEPFVAEEVESYIAETSQAWEQYQQHVAETGEDPLCEFSVKRTTTKRENWVIYFEHWIGSSSHGMKVKAARRARSLVTPENFPVPLADFLILKKQGGVYYMEGIHSKEDIVEAGCVGDGYAKFTLEYERPRNPAAIRKELKAAAQFSLFPKSTSGTSQP